MKKRRQSGQVLITGLIMMVILVLIVLYAFDVHNVIRAKLKVDVAQQSAAMTGANWQKESLNLIGEINLLKASALLLEGTENWKEPLPDREQNEAAWRREIQGRVDLLTEMQTRVSFIGPLIGFSAAQQAAKANGLDRVNNALGTYLDLLRMDQRYDEAQGGAPRYINNYDWKEPYFNLVSRINTNGIAVFPNARVAGMPETRPAQLSNARFYTEIMRCAQAIAANDPPKQHHWNLLNSILRTMDDPDFKGKWWDIDYSQNRFPNESEIFTLGVEFGGEYTENTVSHLMDQNRDLQYYGGQSELPARMKWCIFDQWWLPEYYKNTYADYEQDHYSYWFFGGALRENVKPQYIYEGPAAYVEGYADVTARVNVRPSVRPYAGSDYAENIRKRNAREAVKNSDNPILLRKGRSTSRIGTHRTQAADSDVSTSYRPGSIAKVLGELQGNEAPIAVDMILPVFNKVSPMPTFMPIPYGFQVLKPGYSNLERFLSWLATQNDLNGTPPAGTEHFLEALQYLANGVRARARGESGTVKMELNSNVSGRALRYYGYNHNFDKKAFENEFKERLWEWHAVRDKRVFQQTVLEGPGWLQEPQLFSGKPFIAPKTMEQRDPLGPNEGRKHKDSTIETDENGNRWEVYQVHYLEREGKIYKVDDVTHKVALPDEIYGGTAYRVYVNVKKNASLYYVINSRGQIVLNGSPDPTILYNRHFCDGCNCGGSYWNPGRFDGDRGPARL